jgi:Protein of unknown function DUF262/Protein of unknown function (DUF1524)
MECLAREHQHENGQKIRAHVSVPVDFPLGAAAGEHPRPQAGHDAGTPHRKDQIDMTQTIQNGISSLENLFAVNSFRIPQYQRAYSWVEDPHLEAFLEDLRLQVNTQKKNPEKSYFLGTLLLHEEDVGGGRRVVNVVDGQQRMTTSVVFIATALALHADGKIFAASENPALLRRNFVHDEATGCQKFRTIAEDGPFFQSMILRIAAGPSTDESPSSRRLKEATRYFEKNVQPGEWEGLIRVLRTAKVMVYAVASAEDATQIFELQNDRGKPLTSLEALKSYLMHCIYLHSTARADDRLATIQTQFATIYRSIEALAELNRTPDEKQILANHCAAFLRWSGSEYNDPKHLVKATIKEMDGAEVVSWIESFVSSLVESFGTIEDLFAKRDILPEFAQLLLLGRMGSLWPMILKTWRLDNSPGKEEFRKTCRLLEVFTFRGYAVANLRSDTGLPTLYAAARDLRDGGFTGLFQLLANISLEHNLEERFGMGLDNSYFYDAEGKDALYLLWRYENYLRELPGKIQSLLSWRDFDEPRNDAAKLSVEHVAARGNPMSDTVVKWSDDGEPKPFHEVALNRLGNLVIDSTSLNSSKGKKDFHLKLKSLSENSSYLSQGELIGFLKDREALVWDVNAIRARHIHLIAFARKTWNPKTWHNP